MKNQITIVGTLLLLLIIASCKKTTPTPPNLAIITTDSIVEFDVTSISSGGTILDDGGSAVTQRGVCWGTNPYPTINDSLTKDGAGTGHFQSVVLTLKRNTQYYLRAYAVNAAGVAYGLQQTFWTTDIVVGDTFGGGIVSYILKQGDKGFLQGYVSGVIFATERDSSRAWGCLGTDIAGTSDLIGFGKANSQAILKGCSDPSFAAEYCDKLVYNGYSDWFLPSEAELMEGSKVYPIPVGSIFWTSTQKDANNTRVITRNNNGLYYGWATKEKKFGVQPARYFSTPL